MRDAFALTEKFNTTANVFASTIAHVRYAVKHSRPDSKSKKTVTRANAKRAHGNAQTKHAAHDVERLAIHIIRHLMENTLILWAIVHTHC